MQARGGVRSPPATRPSRGSSRSPASTALEFTRRSRGVEGALTAWTGRGPQARRLGAVDSRRERRSDSSVELVRRPGGPPARAGAHLPSTWQYVGHAGRVESVGDRFSAWAGERAGARRPGRGRAACLPERLPPPGLAARRGRGQREVGPVPLPRVDVRARRLAARRAALGARAGLRSGGLSLVPLRLETWGPFLFVNPDEDAPPLAETLGPLPTPAGRRPRLPLPRRVRARRQLEDRLRELPRVLPLPVAHKGFSAAYDVDPDEYRLEPIAEHVLSQFAHTRDGGEGQAQFHFVWPNLRINVFAGAPNLSLGPLLPAGPSARAGSSTTSSRPTRIQAGWRSCSPSTGRSAPRTACSSSACRRACGRASSRRAAARGERAARGALPGARRRRAG